jgi:hypothetical protein
MGVSLPIELYTPLRTSTYTTAQHNDHIGFPGQLINNKKVPGIFEDEH